ncbi:MAG: class I SAM-dependent methyltransferase [Actinomycetota bacterium]|nr:class I SAM-dependent methyltransferase [Actinomycetota bacterium]
MGYPLHDTTVYDAEVDPSLPNHSHSYSLAMVGFNKRVLELGCTAGHFTRALVKQGCAVVGVEIDPAAAEGARAVAEQVVVADLDHPEALSHLAESQFDVVMAGDTLEHLRDPLPVLRTCRRLLKPEGFVVVSVPNVAHADLRLTLLAGRFPYRESGLLDSTHLRFFTRQTLHDLLWAAGFVTVDIKRVVVPIFQAEFQVDPSQFPASVIERILEDPEAETYQFVVKAVLDDGHAASRELSGKYEAIEEQLYQRGRELARMADRLGACELEVAAATNAAAAAGQRSTDLERLAAEASDRAVEAERALAALLDTRTVRYLAPFRRGYGRVRGTLRRLS